MSPAYQKIREACLLAPVVEVGAIVTCWPDPPAGTMVVLDREAWDRWRQDIAAAVEQSAAWLVAGLLREGEEP